MKEAQDMLGDCYYHGNGAGKNFSEAVRWYRRAAEQGSQYAQYSLGNCYYHGNGVDKDFAEAVKWYRRAAEQGSQYAQYSLGWCSQYGQGVPIDVRKAIELYRKAAQQGHAPAIEKLKDPWLELAVDGVFGVRFGDRFLGEKEYLSDGLKIKRYTDIKLSKSNHHYRKGNWDEICVDITPKSHLIYRITASKHCQNGEAGDAERDSLMSLFEKKYNVTSGWVKGDYKQSGFHIRIGGLRSYLEVKYTDLSLEKLAKNEYNESAGIANENDI